MKRKKALIIATVVSLIDKFNWDNIYILLELGYEVHIATNFDSSSNPGMVNDYNNMCKEKMQRECLIIHEVNFNRSPFSFHNIYALYQLLQIMNKYKFEVIHLHSPVGGFLGRISAKVTKVKNVIYTVHGFHFYKGMQKSGYIYKIIEILASRWTDILITINKEDFGAAQKLKLKQGGRVYYIPGVGIDVKKISSHKDRGNCIRNELGIPNDAIVMVSVGELNKNKNHIMAIKAMARLIKLYPDMKLYYVICGVGQLYEYLIAQGRKLGVSERLKLIGFRNDIPSVLNASDIFVFPSIREGLPVSLMEAMAVGLPIVATRTRGNTDLVFNGENGYLVDINDDEGMSKYIGKIVNNKEVQEQFSFSSMCHILSFDKEIVHKKMKEIFSSLN